MTSLERERRPERMDQPGVETAELEHSLADLRRVNRWLGGTRAILAALAPMVRRVRERPVRILDVATGSADVPLALARWGRAQGVPLRVVATDFHPDTLAAARERAAADADVEVRLANALDLPFEDGAFHLALCNTALHHFDPPDAVAVLRELDRVSSRGMLVSDLRRSRPALLGAQLLAATVWRRHPITRHDAPVSVRAAFTPEELTLLAQAAGLSHARVRRSPVFRLLLVAERAGAGR